MEQANSSTGANTSFLTKLFIIFIYITFSLASWTTIELIVEHTLTKLNMNTNKAQMVVYGTLSIVTLAIIIYNKQLGMIADRVELSTEIRTIMYQIALGITFITFWTATWDSINLSIEKILSKLGLSDYELPVNFAISIITLIILIGRGEMDMLIW